MLSLVNYGNSDSENEITDEEDEVEAQDPLNGPNFNNLNRIKIQLPEKTLNKIHIQEEDDEFLRIKPTPIVPPPSNPLKKEKVKITIPRLSDFKDDEEEDKKIKPKPALKGLLASLPRPSGCFAPSPKPSTVTSQASNQARASTKPQTSHEATSKETTKKVGLIPYALMSHATKPPESKKPSKRAEPESDDDDEDHVGSYFTFDSKHEVLPQSEAEVEALVAQETARMELKRRQAEATESTEATELYEQQVQQQEEQIDEAAMRALLGGNRAKRSKLDNIKFIDLSSNEVLPNKDEWMRKTLAGETSYMPTGNILEKVIEDFHCSIVLPTEILVSRDLRLWRSENIKFLSYPCELRPTSKNWKRCGPPTDKRNASPRANTDFNFSPAGNMDFEFCSILVAQKKLKINL